MRYTSKYHDLIAENRINFAISDLKSSGLLNCPKRSYYELSDLGKKALSELGTDITAKYVHSLPKYVEYQKQRKQNSSDEKADNDIQSLELTEGQIHNWFDKQKENLSDELLTKLRKTDPYVFEHMMIELMTRMGYKGADLTKLMIEYKVGVQVQHTFELLEIDNDFFDKRDN